MTWDVEAGSESTAWVEIECTRAPWSMVEEMAISGYRLVALKRMLREPGGDQDAPQAR